MSPHDRETLLALVASAFKVHY